ncbi:MAG: 4Fe-4S dicluster domain-containing protein, partial [Verrucomicrobia bacterium]|nr:4Fe-4S dicluster domain-containing protein [Verrucomicrobiota bacterium]
LDMLSIVSRKFTTANQGGLGLAVLVEPCQSPSRDRLLADFARRFPQARVYSHDPLDLEVAQRAAIRVLGQSGVPYYKLDQANVIVSLDCDLLGAEEDRHRSIRLFAQRRRVENTESGMNRLYAAEALLTLTGANADHRLRVASSAIPGVAAALATEVIKASGTTPAAGLLEALSKIALPAGVNPKWIQECAKDLAKPENKGKALVVAGHRQPLAVHAIAHAINAALGSLSSLAVLKPSPPPVALGIQELAQDLSAGKVDTLVILGGNPGYTAPAELGWSAAQRKARTVIRLSYYQEDETSAQIDWQLPAAHFLESWGDGRTSDGSYVPVQPLIDPLFGGLTELEVLARLMGAPVVRPHEIVQQTFRSIAGASAADFDARWGKFLHDGFLPGSNNQSVAASVNYPAVIEVVSAVAVRPAPTPQTLEVIFHRDYSLDDGRYNNNGWLQELPDPITKITWDNVVLMSNKTAKALGLANKELVEISVGDRKVRGPVWIQAGLADNVVALALGYGREKSGRVGGSSAKNRVGFNAYSLRTSDSLHLASGAKLARTGETFPISITQEHGSMEGRPIIREANLEDFKKHPDFARNFDLDSPHHSGHIKKEDGVDGRLANRLYKHTYVEYEDEKAKLGAKPPGPMLHSDVHQWGMTVDLNSCVGCATCVVACQSENNIPIVGKDQVNRNREMQWIRIDRYYSGAMEMSPEDQIDDPQTVVQPMFCLHCENAPCESVCPVNATVHDEEGLNVMAYNRCVGTRYCSNNCPYKVRRFNFFDYNKRPLEQLKGPFYKTPVLSSTAGEWDVIRWFKNPDKGYRPEEEWELMKLSKNPNVSVRMRGVMEKCTYCVQRIEEAKISQKVKARASGNVQVPDGAFKTACQQACPAEAIVFGNLLDPNSQVSRLKKSQRDYSVLGFLDTRPRTTYLAKVRNPNPQMPDYERIKIPLTTKEYMETEHADPFAAPHGAAHAGGHEGAPAESHAEKKGTH